MKGAVYCRMRYAIFERYQAIHHLKVLCINQNALIFSYNNSRTLRSIYCSRNKTIELILNGITLNKIWNDYEYLAIMRKENIFLVPISDVCMDNRGPLAKGKDVFVFRVDKDIKIKASLLKGWHSDSQKMKLLNEAFDEFMMNRFKMGGEFKE